MSDIVIHGAREHNLNNVDLRLPSNRLVCFTGVSGSGKSSLAFDTLYAEGQRRYLESLSSYARHFLGQLPRAKVDQITGLRPAISISQKTAGQNNRSTVGTITEISDYLRVLYARVGTSYCPKCGRKIVAQTRSQIFEHIKVFPEGTKFRVLAPVTRNQRGRCVEILNNLRRKGFQQVRVDEKFYSVDDLPNLDYQARHSIDVVIDRLEQSEENFRRIEDAISAALKNGSPGLIVLIDSLPGVTIEQNVSSVENVDEFKLFGTRQHGIDSLPTDVDLEVTCHRDDSDNSYVDQKYYVGQELYFSADYACSHCGLSFERPTPQMFSFNTSQGMCPHCQGMGELFTFDPDLLIPDKSKSFQQGCVVPLGKWQNFGPWRQHLYQGIATTLEKKYGLEDNSVLETAWEELDERVRHEFLWGAGDTSVVYHWKTDDGERSWRGPFEGIIPKLLKQHEVSTNKTQRELLERFMRYVPCVYCGGLRLNEQARSVRLETLSNSAAFADKKSYSLPELSNLPIPLLLEFLSSLSLSPSGQLVAKDIVHEICVRLGFLVEVGVGYLSIGRPAPTLSGGEMQRIRLAGQIGGGLVGVLYILDEPSIGLHPRDNDRLIGALTNLRDLGNSVIVVEHDEDTMLASDHLVDFGPGPGFHGGQIVASGSVADVLKNQREKSITAKFLVGDENISVPKRRRTPDGRWLVVRGARRHNLKNIDVRIPLGEIVCVTGVSGSGKSSLVNDVLRETLATKLNHADPTPCEYDSIEGVEHLKKLISIDQSPIGRTPRSNPATYIKLFDEIRKLFAETPEARAKGFAPGRFSFNVAGGRCETCEGNGSIQLEMDFLADVWTTCPTCGGRRFNHETVAVKYKGLSIDQVLNLDVETALKVFENIPKIHDMLQTLYDVGLGYMKLGQPSPTLSGGEAQRVKLAKELVKKSSGKTLYLLDEPTTGLHFADIRMLLNVLRRFADAGNSVLIVEHNLDVIKTADWVIDLGPEGGDLGGQIVAEGTPEDVADNPNSWTGRALKEYLSRDRKGMVDQLATKAETDSKMRVAKSEADEEGPIIVRGAREHNLQNISVEIPRNQMTVCCGPSGSGKSSFAIDVVYAEGRRRYVESLSSYARQFLGQIQKPKVERTSGISPSISIEQKTTGRSPRSTVGTITEILDYLRVIFARLGVSYCPDCNIPIGSQSTDQIVARVLQIGHEKERRVLITAPIALEGGDNYDKLWERLRVQGFSRVRVNGGTYSLDNPPTLDRRQINRIELIVDRLSLHGYVGKTADKTVRSRVAASVETALEWGAGSINVIICDDGPEPEWESRSLSQRLSCEKCGRAFEALTPKHFSFNSPLGWCPNCEGLGVRSGANPRFHIHDSKLTLLEGVIPTWSDFNDPTTFATMIAFARATGVPLDTPFNRLDARFRRLIFNGTGDRWIDVTAVDWTNACQVKTESDRRRVWNESGAKQIPDGDVLFRFQFKGLYPAIEEAGRLAPYYRSRLEFQIEESECPDCLGSRLRDDVAAVQFHAMTLDQICRTPLGELIQIFENLELTGLEKEIAGDLVDEVISRIRFLVDVGLDYLTLSRPAPSLSGGESQRIRLAAQIGSGLEGVLYVLDEPTVGLHTRDNRRLIAALHKLRDLGNTLLVVEHDQEVIESADFLVDFGPRAGKQGGLIVASGAPEAVKANESSVTGPYLSGRKSIPIPVNRRILP